MALLRQFRKGLRILHGGHWEAAKRFERRSRYLGVPVAVLTAVVGTSLFASLDSSSNTIKIVAGTVSMIAAVFAAVQTFLNYQERAEQHKRAGVAYGDLRRKVDTALAVPPESDDGLRDLLRKVTDAWSKADEVAPAIPPKIYKWSERRANQGATVGTVVKEKSETG